MTQNNHAPLACNLVWFVLAMWKLRQVGLHSEMQVVWHIFNYSITFINQICSEVFLDPLVLSHGHFSLVKMGFLFFFICSQGDGGEAARQVPPPRVLHMLRLRRQSQAKGPLFRGG